MTHDLAPTPVELAHEQAFSLGEMQVRPATLEVSGPGWAEALEPRVMQVLVVLARARGEVVSRDDLIRACWGGRVVGEDAINRCVARLRRLARERGGFDLATVPRVGYRLDERRPGTRPPGRRFGDAWSVAFIGLALAVVTGAAIWLWSLRPPVAPEPGVRISIAPFTPLGADEGEQELSAGLADHIAGLLGESGADVAVSISAGARQSPRRADMVLGGSVGRDGGLWRVRAYLKDPRADFILWTDDFERPVERSGGLRDEVAAASTEAVYAILETKRQKGLRLDPQTLALYVKGLDALKTPALLREGVPLRAFEQVVERAPTFVDGRAHLALSLQMASLVAAPDRRPDLRRRARAEAVRAIGEGAEDAGAAFDALYFLEREEAPVHIAQAEDQILRGLAAAPQFPFLHMRECRLLVAVGRAWESRAYCQRALALRPMAAPPAHSYVSALYANGELEPARQAAARFARFHPEHPNVRRVRFEMEAFTGAPDAGSALLHDPDTAPPMLDRAGTTAFELLLKARKSGTAVDGEAAMAAFRAVGRAGRADPCHVVKAAATLGRVDEAFAALAAPGMEAASSPDTGCLFDPATEPLRHDPRFWPIAAKAGLVRYWRLRDRWPDFCSGPGRVVDCRAKAARGAE